ncbi:MAG: hypothetical protein ACRECF_10720, partial [Methyloceanibacter sp.]
MAPSLKKHLPYYAWPQEDRALWDTAFAPDLFDDEGRTDHLALATVIGLRTSYARYLGFLQRHDKERLKIIPEARIDSDSVKAFVEHLRQSCRDTSVASLLHTLRQGLGYLFPHRDWSWLKTVAKRIQAGAIPLHDATRGVTSVELYAVGIALMAPVEEELVASGQVTLEGAIQYRDGLIIALLALVPLRRRTLTALTIIKHLVKIGEYWLLDIPAEDTKTKRALEFPLPEDLSKRISLYLSHFRPVVPGANCHYGLWPSTRSRPMD